MPAPAQTYTYDPTIEVAIAFGSFLALVGTIGTVIGNMYPVQKLIWKFWGIEGIGSLLFSILACSLATGLINLLMSDLLMPSAARRFIKKDKFEQSRKYTVAEKIAYIIQLTFVLATGILNTLIVVFMGRKEIRSDLIYDLSIPSAITLTLGELETYNIRHDGIKRPNVFNGFSWQTTFATAGYIIAFFNVISLSLLFTSSLFAFMPALTLGGSAAIAFVCGGYTECVFYFYRLSSVMAMMGAYIDVAVNNPASVNGYSILDFEDPNANNAENEDVPPSFLIRFLNPYLGGASKGTLFWLGQPFVVFMLKKVSRWLKE